VSNKFNELLKYLTYGTFIVLFGLYLSPVVEESKYKNLCIKYSTKGALTKYNNIDIEETLLKETGWTINELAKIEGYKNCIN